MQFENSVEINASAETIYALYADVAAWPKWDPDVTAATIEGEFKSGAKGTIHPKGAPKSDIVFAAVEKNKSFHVVCKLPLCEMRFEHYLAPSQAGTKTTHRVVFSGFLSPFFGRVIGNGIKKTLPAAMNSLKMAAEKA